MIAATYSNIERKPERSVLYALLALSSARAMQNGELMRPSEDALHRALQSQHLAYSIKQAHDGPVLTAAYSPDGSQLVTGGRDGWLKIRDAHTGKPLHELSYPPVTALSVEFKKAPEGGASVIKAVPGGAADRAGIKRFDRIMRIGEKFVTEKEPMPRIIKEFPVGARVTIELMRNCRPEIVEAMLGERHPGIYAAAFSPNGKWIATADEAGKIILWDARSYQEIKEINDCYRQCKTDPLTAK